MMNGTKERKTMDIRQEITNAIIRMIEEGAKKWQQPWQALAEQGLPSNYATGRTYSGVNVLLLWHAASSRGYERNEWLTYKQAQDLNAQVKKGAKGVMCVFFKMVQRASQANDEADAGAEFVPMLKPFWVFNVADIENLPEHPVVGRPAFEPISEAERILAASGACIIHGGNRAFFRVATDEIVLPKPEAFKAPANYYATALHELTHWTGHESRLARTFGKRFGDDAYAFEELVAELGSAFVMSHLGLHDATLELHASYVDSWLSVLRRDKNAILTASRHANAAYQFILERAGIQAADAMQ
ncbi:zincin-like metallopeptidase domain-containing protein [Cutibacterium acnes]